jgi:hypothetical protein
MASAIGRVYNQAFDRSPAGTLAVTNGLLSGVADIVAQSTQIGVRNRFVSLISLYILNQNEADGLPTIPSSREIKVQSVLRSTSQRPHTDVRPHSNCPVCRIRNYNGTSPR